MESENAALGAVVASLGELPALPGIVAGVLQITDDPAAAIAQISDQVQRDPALTAKILQVSNSPYYGMKQQVSSLKLALVILGVREVRNIVLGITVLETVQACGADALFSEGFWRHSVTVGALGKKLGAALSLGLQGEDFVAGLLHDIGKMVLLRQLGKAYERVFLAARGNSAARCAMEQGAFGFDHADAAAALALHWNLPNTLTGALWRHHARDRRRLDSAPNPRLAALVRIANKAYYDDFRSGDAATCASCTDNEAWTVLLDHKPPALDARHRMLAGFAQELEQSPLLEF